MCIYIRFLIAEEGQSVLPNPPDNIECEGEGIVEQAEFCHYRQRERCGPPAILLLERTNISAAPYLPDGSPGVGESGLCSCGFTEGQRTCSLG